MDNELEVLHQETLTQFKALQGRMDPTSQTLYLLHRRLTLLEQANATTSASSAPSTGLVQRPLRSGSVSRAEIGWHTLQEIMAGSKSTKSTAPELVEFWEDSTTLQLTLRWPSTSGATLEVGGPGRASHTDLAEGERDPELHLPYYSNTMPPPTATTQH